MRRTGAWGVVAAAVVLCTAGLAGTSSAVMKPPIDGAGTVTCNVTGTLTFDPALSANGPAVPTTVTLKAHLAGCTGTGDGANVKSGTATVSGQSPTNDCATVLLAKPSGSRSGPLRWVAQPHTPKLNPSTIEFDGGSSSQGPPIIADAAGSSTAGSFSGDGVASHTVLKETVAAIVKKCVGAHGLKALHITTGSTFALSAPAPES